MSIIENFSDLPTKREELDALIRLYSGPERGDLADGQTSKDANYVFSNQQPPKKEMGDSIKGLVGYLANEIYNHIMDCTPFREIRLYHKSNKSPK